MLYAATGVYLVTILFGVANLFSLLQHTVHYKPVAVMHGCLAALGWILLAIHALTADVSGVFLSAFVILTLSSLGGITMLSYRIKLHKRPPALLIGLHPVLSIAGFLFLVYCLVP